MHENYTPSLSPLLEQGKAHHNVREALREFKARPYHEQIKLTRTLTLLSSDISFYIRELEQDQYTAAQMTTALEQLMLMGLARRHLDHTHRTYRYLRTELGTQVLEKWAVRAA